MPPTTVPTVPGSLLTTLSEAWVNPHPTPVTSTLCGQSKHGSDWSTALPSLPSAVVQRHCHTMEGREKGDGFLKGGEKYGKKELGRSSMEKKKRKKIISVKYRLYLPRTQDAKTEEINTSQLLNYPL